MKILFVLVSFLISFLIARSDAQFPEPPEWPWGPTRGTRRPRPTFSPVTVTAEPVIEMEIQVESVIVIDSKEMETEADLTPFGLDLFNQPIDTPSQPNDEFKPTTTTTGVTENSFSLDFDILNYQDDDGAVSGRAGMCKLGNTKISKNPKCVELMDGIEKGFKDLKNSLNYHLVNVKVNVTKEGMISMALKLDGELKNKDALSDRPLPKEPGSPRLLGDAWSWKDSMISNVMDIPYDDVNKFTTKW